jgi:hypothetical protein
MASFLTDPDHWRKRAQQARATASGLDDVESRRDLLVIADAYDRMAARAAARSAER